jgi:hypothetical protein
VGDSAITGIDEQPARGIGSARVIDLANLPLRTSQMLIFDRYQR